MPKFYLAALVSLSEIGDSYGRDTFLSCGIFFGDT
jgi:hypothetical protein